jgi:hypothetical protein
MGYIARAMQGQGDFDRPGTARDVCPAERRRASG